MWYLIIGAIVIYVAYKFLTDLNKDSQDLKNQNIYEKFKVLADNINQSAYQGQGNIRMHPNDKRSFHIYKSNAPQIIEFQYGTGHLTIIWRYKYLGDNEIVYEEILRNVRDVSVEEQNSISKQIIAEMNRRIDKVMKETHGFNRNNKVNIFEHIADKVKKKTEEMAKNGDAESQYNLATDLFKKEKYDDALYWYIQSAKNNDIDAQYQLGNMYLQGLGTDKNMEEAFYWYNKAANQNHAEAQFNLGQFYIQGIFVELDKEKGIYWFKESANNGYEKAQKLLQIIQ